MPQLKIVDVKNQVEETEEKLTERLDALEEKFSTLVDEIKQVLDNANVSVDENTGIAAIERELAEIREGLVGHVQVYNKHIVEQHTPRKR